MTAGQRRPGAGHWDVIVVGAGVFGSWTAFKLLREGKRVLLLDAHGPAGARSSSGGESRLTRTVYGADAVYTRMAWESLPDWKWLSEGTDPAIFQPAGALFLFAGGEAYARQTLDVHRELCLPIETLDRTELARRFPQFCCDDIELGLLEPDFGALMSRRAVQTLVSRFRAAGGEYRLAAVAAPHPGVPETDSLAALMTGGGERLEAKDYVFACGAWLPKLFPELLGGRIFVTRQEIFFFAAPAGDGRFAPEAMPGWVDFNHGDMFYGFPDLEARGVKVACDKHGPPTDADAGDRVTSGEGLRQVRAYMARRFPTLARQPLNESRVCQYENTSNGDFLIDHHPRWRNVWLVGGGSGHGFKHGPAVGRYVVRLLSGERSALEPRFSLETKGDRQLRAVH